EYLPRIPSGRITAGFDIDDTALFSSYGFRWALDEIHTPDGNPLRQSPDFRMDTFFSLPVGPPLQEQKALFWQTMNSELDRYSVPKASVARVIRFHLSRGDRVVFVTGRPELFASGRMLEDRLRECFGLHEAPTVFYTDG